MRLPGGPDNYQAALRKIEQERWTWRRCREKWAIAERFVEREQQTAVLLQVEPSGEIVFGDLDAAARLFSGSYRLSYGARNVSVDTALELPRGWTVARPQQCRRDRPLQFWLLFESERWRLAPGLRLRPDMTVSAPSLQQEEQQGPPKPRTPRHGRRCLCGDCFSKGATLVTRAPWYYGKGARGRPQLAVRLWNGPNGETLALFYHSYEDVTRFLENGVAAAPSPPVLQGREISLEDEE